MLYKTTILRRKTIANRYRMCSVSIQLIFHVSMRGHKKDEEISLLQLRGRQRCCLTSYVVWAIILTESMSALFISCGPLVLLFSVTNQLMGTGTIELLQLKNCASEVCTGNCYGPAVTFFRSSISEITAGSHGLSL